MANARVTSGHVSIPVKVSVILAVEEAVVTAPVVVVDIAVVVVFGPVVDVVLEDSACLTS